MSGKCSNTHFCSASLWPGSGTGKNPATEARARSREGPFDWQRGLGSSAQHTGARGKAVRGPLDAYTAKPPEFQHEWNVAMFLFSRTQNFKRTETILEKKLIH